MRTTSEHDSLLSDARSATLELAAPPDLPMDPGCGHAYVAVLLTRLSEALSMEASDRSRYRRRYTSAYAELAAMTAERDDWKAASVRWSLHADERVRAAEASRDELLALIELAARSSDPSALLGDYSDAWRSTVPVVVIAA